MRRRLAFAFALTLAAAPAAAEPLRLVALGDLPYGAPEEALPPFRALIDAINAAGPDLVIHVGDTKGGGSPCDDARLAQELEHLNAFEAPTLYTPGDNEWTDCHRESAGGFDPLERLAHIRKTYFADPAASFGGEAAALEHQGEAGHPENARMMRDGVMILTVHVVGSNNGFEPRSLASAREAMERSAAGAAWIRAGFEAAGAAQAQAVVVALHANMFQHGFGVYGDERWLGHSGFGEVGAALRQAAAAFGGPVLLIYGDSHVFRVTRPFPRSAPNLTAVEVFGARDMHAVEVTVDPAQASPFAIRPLLNPAQP